MLKMDLPKSEKTISHGQNILAVGSCFTEHIGAALTGLKFNVLQNPNGILFDPASVATSVTSYIQNHQYAESDLFQLGEIWHSWRHHSHFSGTDKNAVIDKINNAQQEAHQFITGADWLMITLGTSFSYRLKKDRNNEELLMNFAKAESDGSVANCHRAPAQWFQKHLLTVDEIVARIDGMMHQLFHVNPNINIIFTVSPVRHIRDGLVENNRSKARLLEAVHHLVGKFNRLFYFPSYELVMDVLRDYRFYAEDMVHPNYLATDFVLQQFTNVFMTEETNTLNRELKKLQNARKHRSAFPATAAHQAFLKNNLEKVKAMQQQYPFLNLFEEIAYFSTGGR